MKVTEFSRFQLEANRLGRDIVFQVTVFERRSRSKSKLYAQTQCYDPQQHIIQFVIREADTLDDVIQMFSEQLLHRGFIPAKYRLRNEHGGWGAWQAPPT